MSTATHPYLGTQLVGSTLAHTWADGSTLRVLRGGAGDDDDTDPGDDDTTDDSGDGKRKFKTYTMDPNDDPAEFDEDDVNSTDPAIRRSSRQAARYRVTAKANLARAESAELRSLSLLGELAFVRAAGSQFVDTDAAWKLADRTLIEIDDEGNVTGADLAVQALVESHPFTVAKVETETTDRPERNPFKPSASGKPVTRGKHTVTGPSPTALAKKYPALGGR